MMEDNKVCPLLKDCCIKNCALFDDDRNQCAILITALGIAGLDEGGIRIFIYKDI